MRATRAWVEDETGKQVGRIRSGDRAIVVVHFDVVADTDEPVFGVGLAAEAGTVLYSVNTHWDGTRTQQLRGGQRVEVRVPMMVALRNGRYAIQVGAAHRDLSDMHDMVDCIATLVVHGSRARHGLTDLQGRVTYRVVDEEIVAVDVRARPLKRGVQ